MDVSTLTVPRKQAAELLEQYRRGAEKKKDPEYVAIADALEEAVKGRPLLIMSEVLRQAPRDEKGRPMLALARSDRQRVRFTWSGWTDAAMIFDAGAAPFSGSWGWNETNPRFTDLRLVVPTHERVTPPRVMRRAEPHPWPEDIHERKGYTMVPKVPPAIAEGRDLRKYFTLFEVEQWQDELPRDVPRDPFLLARVGADLYAIIAEWELTELEQRILAAVRAGR